MRISSRLLPRSPPPPSPFLFVQKFFRKEAINGSFLVYFSGKIQNQRVMGWQLRICLQAAMAVVHMLLAESSCVTVTQHSGFVASCRSCDGRGAA